MKRWGIAITASVALAACSVNDRPQMSEFVPLGDETFRFEADADAIRPEDSPGAEQERMTWLRTYLSDNGLCPTGYEITERTPVLIQRGLLGDVYKIHYDGRCTPA